MPNGGSSLISLLGLYYPVLGQSFLWCGGCYLVFSRVILEFKADSKCLDGPLLVVSRG